MEETILTAQNLKFRYDSDQPVYALDGVSTEVKRGEFVAVLGANGCGKSTLAKHFNAILLPESGKVYVEGMDTADDDKIYDIRQTVGMVFQNPDNQIVATVVEEDVAFALENLGVPPEEMRRRVDDSMKMAGIYEYRERAPHNLSGGQKQRVAIAGVVAMRPDCLILDEATAMLDPRGREQVMQTIPPEQEYGHHRGVHHPLHGGSCAGRPCAGDEQGPCGDGGHPQRGVQPDREGALPASGYRRLQSCGTSW